MNLSTFRNQWMPVCRVKAVSTKPRRYLLLNMPLVIVRLNDKIVAFQDRCPHRGAPLSTGKIINGALQCSYHGWCFNDKGACIAIPGLLKKTNLADKGVLVYPTAIHHGLVFICLDIDENTLPPYDIPALVSKDYRYHFMQFEIQSDILNIIENTLDATHTHFIHAGLLRHDSKRQIISAHLKVDKFSAEVRYEGEQKQSGFISSFFEKSRQSSIGRFQFPLVAELEYYGDGELTAAFTFFMCPNTEAKHQVFAFISYRYHWFSDWLKVLFLLPFVKFALKQDLAILEKQDKNLACFEKTTFKSTELDILRPHIARILNNTSSPYQKTITLQV